MLIEVHHGDACVLLVNGNCRPVHLLNYIRTRCSLSSSIKLDLCLINSGEPFHLSSSDTKLVSSERRRFPSHAHCVLTRIDEEGTYIPLLNDPKLITSEFLTKLKRATSATGPPKVVSIPGKQLPIPSNESPRRRRRKQLPIPSNESARRRRSLKTLAIAATIITKCRH